MNVLFIGLEQISDIKNRGLYTDFLREMVKHGHSLTVLTANEKRNRRSYKSRTTIENVSYLLAKTGNITKNSNFISKGISVILAGWQYLLALMKNKKNYDLVICATPCITFERAMRYAKKKGNAKTVLLLKDLWPYDLVFDGILRKSGIKGLIYRYLEQIAIKLFDASDVIGCMTPKNKVFLEEVYNGGKHLDRACVIPNSIEPLNYNPTDKEKQALREKYDLPLEKTIFVYGGNLGVAQGPDFIIEAISNAADKNPNAFFLIIGDGTDYQRIHDAFEKYVNVKCMPAIARDDYEKLIYACNVGLVFLNWNCHSPNSPSRILQYLQASKPIICAVDDTTDVGIIAEKYEFGICCDSNDSEAFSNSVADFLRETARTKKGSKAKEFFELYLTAATTYSLIFSEEQEK